MTAPFRDPIIYPGEPMQIKPGGDQGSDWRRLRLPTICNIGGEQMAPDTIVRLVPPAQMIYGIYECRGHVEGATS